MTERPTIQVLAMHEDEHAVFVPTPEQAAAIANGSLRIGIIRYAPNPDYVPPAGQDAAP
ncbi:hypothetical protein CcrC1_gp083 [Caulobacter phage C1]|nr:hypothetical protein CcrC1_gp083 [Caulobacter phage C1]UTU08311.1 hypothetical protein CcrC2_gp083 [Caulobacter phage C2]UTU08832.1 hypothetical protein CcrJ4_gp081 [Caulobacter phage J4]UTU09385.1 hypothetical protein CcrBL47_gp099 [Caulobacter phage BL47]UTU09945.1 hypothetical protein CcrRB23_gp083 [Caulobacter phage RB23]WGN96970.1 hypothetical protein [Bertelyvirus sp.]